jgi:hypothetical protein
MSRNCGTIIKGNENTGGKQRKGIEERIMTENLLKLVSDFKLQLQDSQSTSCTSMANQQ